MPPTRCRLWTSTNRPVRPTTERAETFLPALAAASPLSVKPLNPNTMVEIICRHFKAKHSHRNLVVEAHYNCLQTCHPKTINRMQTLMDKVEDPVQPATTLLINRTSTFSTSRVRCTIPWTLILPKQIRLPWQVSQGHNLTPLSIKFRAEETRIESVNKI